MFNAASAHASAESAKLFALVDKDGDGVLTEEELKGVRRVPDTSPAYRPAHTALACDLTLRFTLSHCRWVAQMATTNTIKFKARNTGA